MNDIEKAIETLRSIYPSQKEIRTGEYDHVADALDDAISALEQQLHNGWIPVSERLPEEARKCYLCTDSDGVVEIVYREHFKNRDCWMNGMHTRDDIVAWKPIPEAYQP